MLVKDLQQFLSSFTDKLKGNAISHARIYIEKNVKEWKCKSI